jgi:hypothetical protein
VKAELPMVLLTCPTYSFVAWKQSNTKSKLFFDYLHV